MNFGTQNFEDLKSDYAFILLILPSMLITEITQNNYAINGNIYIYGEGAYELKRTSTKKFYNNVNYYVTLDVRCT